jgi:hypothetical protein
VVLETQCVNRIDTFRFSSGHLDAMRPARGRHPKGAATLSPASRRKAPCAGSHERYAALLRRPPAGRRPASALSAATGRTVASASAIVKDLRRRSR